MPTSDHERTGRVFISYRREDTQHVAGRLADRLGQRFGDDNVFMDVDSIEPGVDFSVAIERAVADCDVLVALIGPSWSSVLTSHGGRRLDDPTDFVALEIRAALTRNVRVIPVLVDGADMPSEDELPPALRPLARRNAVTLDHQTFRMHTEKLLATIDGILAQRIDGRDANASRSRAAALPPPTAVDPERSAMSTSGASGPAGGAPPGRRGRSTGASARRRHRWIGLGVASVVILATGSMAVATMTSGGGSAGPTTTSAPSSTASVDERGFCDRSLRADSLSDQANVLLMTPQDERTSSAVRSEIERMYTEVMSEMAAVVDDAPSEIRSAAQGVQRQGKEMVDLLERSGWSIAEAGPQLVALDDGAQDQADTTAFDKYLRSTCDIQWSNLGLVDVRTAAQGIVVIWGAVFGVAVTPAQAECGQAPLEAAIPGDAMIAAVAKSADITDAQVGVIADALQRCVSAEQLAPGLGALLFPALLEDERTCIARGVLETSTLSALFASSGPADEVLAEAASGCGVDPSSLGEPASAG